MLVTILMHTAGLSPGVLPQGGVPGGSHTTQDPVPSRAIMVPALSFHSTYIGQICLPSAQATSLLRAETGPVCSPLYPRSLAPFLQINIPFPGAAGRVWVWDMVWAVCHHPWSWRVGGRRCVLGMPSSADGL